MQKLLTLIALFVLAAPVHALEIQKVKVPEQAEVAGKQLSLNGAGLRKKLFLKIYVGALYLAEKADNPEAVFAQDGPKRVWMHFIFGDIGADKMTGGWIDGFNDNLEEAELDAVRSRLDDFNALFGTVREGEVIIFDYLPGQGTSVIIGGEQRGVIPGKDFNTALLKVWLGSKPASKSMKAAWLGKD